MNRTERAGGKQHPPASSVFLRKNPRVSMLLPFAGQELAALLRTMLLAAGQEGRSVELALLDDAAMEALNRSAMGCPGPTNILSFPAGAAERPGIPEHTARPPLLPAAEDTEEPPALLGWLALAPETLLRECLLYGQNPEEHCIRLLAHGLAHLLGYDHGPAMDALAASMERAANMPGRAP